MLPNLSHISWNKLENLIIKLAQKIQEDSFHPDLLVAISRGGFVPARILSDQLGVRRLTCIQIEYYKGIYDVKKKPNLVFPLNADINGLNVLIIDDISDSGTSMIEAINHISDSGARTVKTSSLHIKPWTDYIPDYYAEKVENWIVYPWEIVETLNDISQKLLDQEKDIETIRSELVRLGFNPIYVENFNPRR
jgi:hypoxanthine phosphoribosyltransferase